MKNPNKINNPWISKNWKWLLASCLLIAIFSWFFLAIGMGKISADLAKAYTDTALYTQAIRHAQANPKVNQFLGTIKPIDKLAILEGEVHYTNNDKTVQTTVRITGTKGKARLDITAEKEDSSWHYKTITVRIKNPPQNKQRIQILLPLKE